MHNMYMDFVRKRHILNKVFFFKSSFETLLFPANCFVVGVVHFISYRMKRGRRQ